MPGEKKKMGRPPTGIGPVVGVRLYPDIEEALEAWIAQQPNATLSKPEAIRRILRKALGATPHSLPSDTLDASPT
jgi:hypothetical protein